MSKKENGFIGIFVLVVLILLFIVGGYYFYKNYAKKEVQNNMRGKALQYPTPTSDGLKVFKSTSAMDFTITVPQTYQVFESLGSVEISLPEGKIQIGQNATNFESLEEFIKDSKGTSYDRIQRKEINFINGLESLNGIIDGRKTYFIYADYNVYLLWTDVESLYDDLDQIAQSFQYTP